MTDKEAMEVEAALIDDYSVGITNIQSGYAAYRAKRDSHAPVRMAEGHSTGKKIKHHV